MRARLVVLLFAALLTTAAGACGGDNLTFPGAATPTPQETATPTPTPTPIR
jgi:hypothetical protein